MIILTRPERLHVNNPANYIRWQSNRQPFLFQFGRYDNFATIVNSGGFIRANLGSWLGFVPPLNSKVTLVLPQINQNNVQVGFVPFVGTITSSNFAQLYFITDIPFPVNYGNFANVLFSAKENYKIYLTVTAFAPTLGNEYVIGTLVGTPNGEGKVNIDVRTLCEYEMKKLNRFGYDVRNELDYSGWLRFRIGYKAQYTYNQANVIDVEVPQELINGNPVNYYAVDGSKYLLSEYGQNYADYVPQLTALPLPLHVKFLTTMPEPTYFIGYPFSLNYINSEFIIGQSITSEEDELNGNLSLVGHQDFNLITLKDVGICHLMLSGTYNAQTEFVDVWLEAGGVASNLYVQENYVANNYIQETPAVPTTPVRITEKKRVTINNDCRSNPIYLMWKNSLGGWDYWLFDSQSETQIQAKQTGTFSVYNTDIATAVYRDRLLSASQSKRITVGTVVSKAQADALIEIERSPQVFMLYDITKLPNNPELAWIGVNIVPKGVKYINLAKEIEVEIQFELPEYYNTSN